MLRISPWSVTRTGKPLLAAAGTDFRIWRALCAETLACSEHMFFLSVACSTILDENIFWCWKFSEVGLFNKSARYSQSDSFMWRTSATISLPTTQELQWQHKHSRSRSQWQSAYSDIARTGIFFLSFHVTKNRFMKEQIFPEGSGSEYILMDFTFSFDSDSGVTFCLDLKCLISSLCNKRMFSYVDSLRILSLRASVKTDSEVVSKKCTSDASGTKRSKHDLVSAIICSTLFGVWCWCSVYDCVSTKSIVWGRGQSTEQQTRALVPLDAGAGQR